MPLRPIVPSRKAFVAILSSTAAFWDQLIAVGARFHGGSHRPATFPETLPLAGFVLANCGIDPRGAERDGDWPAWNGIGRGCKETHVVARLSFDDGFWGDVCAGKLVLGNLG